MHIKEKVQRYKALYEQAKAKAEEGELDAAEAMMKEADDLKAQATRELDILKRASDGMVDMIEARNLKITVEDVQPSDDAVRIILQLQKKP